MSEPATKDDIETLRKEMQAMGRSLEGMRSQNSAEHGAITGTLRLILGPVQWLQAKWDRFMHNDQPWSTPKSD